MTAYDSSTYGESISEIYDEWFGDFDEEVVNRIYELAPNGTALELGIGTGRIAIPLAQKGMRVSGIDASIAMVEKLRKKPNGDTIDVQIGDFADFKSDKKYDIVYVVYNTFFGLLTQDDQINCFKSVYSVLKDNGVFLIEAFFPDVARFENAQAMRTSKVNGDYVRMECSKHDAINQSVTSQLVKLSAHGIKLYPIKIRYAWPSEIDLMGRLTGFGLKERWGSWKKDVFSNTSGFHVSIFDKTE